MRGRTRVAVIGAAGRVGSATAYSLIERGYVAELFLVDRSSAAVEVLQMDLEQVAAKHGGAAVCGADLADAADADVVVLCASVPHRDGVSRRGHLHANLAIVDEVASELSSSGCTLVVVTNPVDVLCTLLTRSLGWPPGRVLGYVSNDTSRFRFAAGQVLRADPSRITAMCLGEHGHALVPLFSRLRLDGRPVVLTPDQRREVIEYLDTWYGRWQTHNTGWTSAFMTADGVADLVAALVGPPPDPSPMSLLVVLGGVRRELWPISLVSHAYGLPSVAVGLPVRLDTRTVVEIELTHSEQESLQAAARAVESTVELASFVPSPATCDGASGRSVSAAGPSTGRAVHEPTR